MTNDHQPDEIRSLWQKQDSGSFRMSPEEIRRRVRALEKNLRRRTWAGLAVCLLVVAGAVYWLAIFDDPLQRLGSVLTIAGVAYLAWQLRRTDRTAGSDLARAAASGGMESTAYHRAALERLRDFHRGKALWSRLAILVPGPIIFFIGFANAHPEVGTTIRIEAIVFAAFVVIAVPLNLKLAGRYARQIAELDQLRKEA
jgi:hypothetical protein